MGISSSSDFNGMICKFEFNLPFSKITLQEFESRVKMLVFPEDKGFVTINQLTGSFADCNPFYQLSTKESFLVKMFTSKYLTKENKSLKEL